MLNIDPLLFQPKVIRMSTTSNIGLPGQHIIRTTEYSNSQVMTGTTAHVHNEANNNILTSNNAKTIDDFSTGSLRRTVVRDRRNFNEMDQNTEQETDEGELPSAQQAEWTLDQMYWSGDGEVSDSATLELLAQQNSASIISFQSNLSNSSASASFHSQLSEQSESKEEVISSLLNKVKSQNKVEASKILLAMSNTVENCIAMRQCGCLPLLIQLLHSPDENSNTYHMVHAKRVNFEIRERASQVLHNIVFSQPDDKKGRREARVLRLLEQIRDYCDQLRCLDGGDIDDNRNARCVDQHLGPAVAALMKLSFDEDHRYAMCQLGGLQAIAELLQVDQDVHGCTNDQYCITIRRYSGMALTNLTFGDGANKALLCSMRPFMEALVAQLYSPSEDLRQVTASVLRNLSWRADPASKRVLRDVGAVPLLVKAAMSAEKESTLKSILSALWNLSAHCSGNKADICQVEGALAFLVSTLTYKSKAKTLAIVENGGGILRNVSSHVAIQNEYRQILRRHNCLQILLHHLKSPSLTVVSNACGTLWNLSARNAADQRALWEMGAVGMLKKLINSKHKMISMGSSAALKNLLSAKPPGVSLGLCDSYRSNEDAPSLMVRKQKALSTEIDQNLSETYDNTDSPKTSPVKQATQTRSRRHISPSAARYLANQRLKNELSLTQRSSGVDAMNGAFVVEEKHNGAFQVTKNAKQVLNYRQGRFQDEPENDPPKPSFAPARQGIPSPHHAANRPPGGALKNASRSMSPMGVRKEHKTPNRPVTAGAPARIPEPVQAPKPEVQKPAHESRIPLPKSVNKVDSQRSQSASPVPQRRIPQPVQQQRQDNSKYVDITVTHPKYAWNSSPEKQDNDPEQPVNFSKRLGRDQQDYPVKPGILRLQEDCNYTGEDEVKVYNTEHTPSNYSLMSSMNDLEDTAAPSRCSLNIKTTTNVRMIKNHPLLANRCDENGRLFESRHAKRDDHNQEFDGAGKTVDFSVQSDYDIDETLSMMSRSSSVASISSFDQQSFHEDESFASDLSHHTSGIESPSELSDSPCQTAPTSPLKSQGSSNYISLCGDPSEQVQPTSSGEVPPSLSCQSFISARQELDEVKSQTSAAVTVSIEKPETIPSHAIEAEVRPSQPQETPNEVKKSPPNAPETDRLKPSETPRASRSSSSSIESMDDISPSEKLMLEECIRAGMPQGQGTKQKVPQLSYQLLRDTVERHPKACSFESERGVTLKNLEVKEAEYESLSENEEKGKEDERKAEKNRLFRIPESPVDKKTQDQYQPIERKTVLDQKGNRRSERCQGKGKGTKVESPIPSQLEFLMTSQKNSKSGSKTSSQIDGPRVEDSKPTSGTAPSVVQEEKSDSEIHPDVPHVKISQEIPEKDVDCSARVNSDEIPMATSGILEEAKEIAEALLGARVDSTEDMTVSTLSCLSDIDNARPPSVMADLGCLSMTNSIGSEDSLKVAVTKECQKAFGKTYAKQIKKSLLRELQMGRLTSDNGDNSKGSNESADNLSLKSSCASDLLGNVNPPSLLDEMSLTASTGSLNSLEGSDSECEPERNLVGRFASNQDSMSERMNDAAAMAQLYAKELSNITGANVADPKYEEAMSRIRIPSVVQEAMEVTIADVTEFGCDTIGSDTELEEDLPCDDEDPASETLQVAQTHSMTKDDSMENLTLTLTEEQAKQDLSPFLEFQKQSGYFMTSEEFKALQENADMILNTLKDVEISDEEEENCGNSNGDLLEDETMSLVSNESDDEFLSPGHQFQKTSPRTDFLLSPTCNGMVSLPQSSAYAPEKVSARKTSLPSRNKQSGLPKTQAQRNRFSYPNAYTKQESNLNDDHQIQTHSDQPIQNGAEPPEEFENGVFDSRTFTRKRTSIPKEMVPSVPAPLVKGSLPRGQPQLKSPSGGAPPFPSVKAVESKIAGVWKNGGKARSKSADVNRNSKLKLAACGTQLSYEDDKNGSSSQRPSSQSSSPKSPLSRSNTFEKLNDEVSPPQSIRRPGSLALAQKSNSPRHTRGMPLPQRGPSGPQDAPPRQRTLPTKNDDPTRRNQPHESAILSPSSNIPKFQNKAQTSLIPGRRSMIPTPAKIGQQDN